MECLRQSEHFHIILKGGVGYDLRPEPGFKLQVRFIATQANSKGKVKKSTLSVRTAGSRQYKLIATMKGGDDNHCTFNKNVSFYENVELFLSEGEAIVFCCWVLFNEQQLLDSYSDSDSECVVPEPGDRTCTWQVPSSGFLQSPSSSSSEAPELVNTFDEDDAPDITPPRVFSLVASSSPERSISRSSEERGGYYVRVPQGSPALQPPPLSIVNNKESTTDQIKCSVAAAVCIVLSEAVRCRMSRIALLKQRELSKRRLEASGDGTGEDCVIPTGALIPQGVLKRKSRLKRSKLSCSPHHSPAMAPKTNKKNVNWNPRSPDVRFISPPLSAIHKAFSGGLLDIGIPMLSDMPSVSSSSLGSIKTSKTSSPLSVLSDSDNDFATSQPPVRRTPHRPHLQPKITPMHLRPTVIE